MRFFATAMIALLLGGAASAEPPKTEPKQAAQHADSRPRPTIVLASAEPVRGTAEAAPAPPKRLVAPRLTSCRCGDPQTRSEPEGE